MKVAIISFFWKEEKLAKLFCDTYSFANKIFIFLDTEVDDRTKEIISKYPNVKIIPFTFPNGFDDGIKVQAINEKMHMCVDFDWVIAVDSDEFIYDSQALTILQNSNSDYHSLHLFNVFRHKTEFDFDPNDSLLQRTHGKSIQIKPCIVRPSTELNWTVGCHQLNPNKIEGAPIKGVHWRLADPIIGIDRCIERKKRISQNNRNHNWGYHNYDITEGLIGKECLEHINDPQVIHDHYLNINNPRLRYYKEITSKILINGMWEEWQKRVEDNITQFAGEGHYLTQGGDEQIYQEALDRLYSLCPYVATNKYRTRDCEFGAIPVKTNDGLVTRAWLDGMFEVNFLTQNLPEQINSILDIGAGYGRLAVFLQRYFKYSEVDVDIICTDKVPVSLFLCEYYTKRFSKDIKVISNTTHYSCDLVINVHSWNECYYKEIDSWLNKISCKYLFTVSHNDKWLSWDNINFRKRIEKEYDIVKEMILGLEQCPHVLWRKR